MSSKEIHGLFDKYNTQNLICNLHDEDEVPATYARNESNEIVDGIWGTPLIEVKKAGFLESSEFPGNHSTVWMDITFSSALGHNLPQPTTPQARRLKLSDLKSLQKYLQLYKRFEKQEGLGTLVKEFAKQVIPGTLLLGQEKIAAKLDETRTKCMLKAHKRCCKPQVGEIEFLAEVDGPLKRM